MVGPLVTPIVGTLVMPVKYVCPIVSTVTNSTGAEWEKGKEERGRKQEMRKT
jgi:hypothetical protein